MEPYNYIINTAQQPNFETGLAQGQAMKKAEQDQAAQAQMQADLLQLSHSPTVANISSVMAKYPAIGDKFKPLLDSATELQRQNRISQASDTYAAMLAGRDDVAKVILQEQADAARNAGDERSAKSAEVMMKILDSGNAGRNMLLSSAGMFLSAAMGADKFAETYSKLGSEQRDNELQPAKLTEQQATAAKAATAAKFAESNAALDLQKKGWDITKIQNDIQIAKQNSRIAMMNAQISRETNDLKRQELALKVQDAQIERDEKLRGKVAEVFAARGDIDNMFSTVQQALDTPKNVFNNAVGPVAGKLPAMVADLSNMSAVNDFREVLKTLTSQTMLQQLKNLKATGATMGALNEAEGEALEKSFVNLSTTQSPERLLANLKEAQRLLTKFRSNLTVKYGVPESQVDLRPGSDPNQRTVTVEY